MDSKRPLVYFQFLLQKQFLGQKVIISGILAFKDKRLFGSNNKILCDLMRHNDHTVPNCPNKPFVIRFPTLVSNHIDAVSNMVIAEKVINKMLV